ncbi:MBL fold metallo-hydrolase [Pseudonocardia kunmingensis]|uniref:MBL fold metallo-hydrolase n=1 Tax=Pseudonocardia kunmingensis TaxID=630975 RepID=UPI00114FE829
MDPWPIDYFTWVVLRRRPHGRRRRRVHPGTRPGAGGTGPTSPPPVDLLRRLGREPGDVSDLVLTHLHYDHTGFVGAYPAARIWRQRRELEFWSSPMARRGGFAHLLDPDDLAHDPPTRRRRPRRGHGGRRRRRPRRRPAPGRWAHAGHAGGARDRPTTACGCSRSDASHFYANLGEDKPYGVVCDLPDMYRAFDRLRELAGPGGVVVPGHDPRVTERPPRRAGHGRPGHRPHRDTAAGVAHPPAGPSPLTGGRSRSTASARAGRPPPRP